MGIDLFCNEFRFETSYSHWNIIRETIITTTFDYIIDKFKKDEELYKDIDDDDDENYIGEGSTYYCYKQKIINMHTSLYKFNITNTNILNQKAYLLENILNFITTDISYIDALIYFDIGGLYALCNKNDCQGFYSSGNSKDIIQLFDLIEPFIKNNVDYYKNCYECIYVSEGRMSNKIYDVFKESCDKNEKIYIG